MELSENERLLLVEKKEEIFKITAEIMRDSSNNNEIIIKLNEILSLLSTIEGYAKPDRDLSVFTRLVLRIVLYLENGMNAHLLIVTFCSAVNSIKFDFARRRIKLADTIVLKIENCLAKFGDKP